MIVPTFLEELRRRNIQVRVDGDQLRCTAPTGVLTPELRDRLRQEKRAIVEFLRSAEALARQDRAIVPLQPDGQRVPVFAVPGHNGNGFSFRFLAQTLGTDQPFFGLQPPGIDGECEPLTRVEELASYYATRILAFRPDGPYAIAGHCAGGAIAFELARQLAQQGANVTFLALFGSPYPTWFRRGAQLLERLGREAAWIGQHVRSLASLSNGERLRYIAARMTERRRQRRLRLEAHKEIAVDPVLIRRAKVEAATVAALRRFTPHPFTGQMALFLPNRAWLRRGHSMRWRGVSGEYEEHYGPDGCESDTMLHEPSVRVIAEQFQACAQRAESNLAAGTVSSSAVKSRVSGGTSKRRVSRSPAYLPITGHSP